MNNIAARALLDKLEDMGLSYPYQLARPSKSPFFVFILVNANEDPATIFPEMINIIWPTPSRVWQVLEAIVEFDKFVYDPTDLYYRFTQTAVLYKEWEDFQTKTEPHFPFLFWNPLKNYIWNGTPSQTFLTLPEWLEIEWERLQLDGRAVPKMD